VSCARCHASALELTEQRYSENENQPRKSNAGNSIMKNDEKLVYGVTGTEEPDKKAPQCGVYIPAMSSCIVLL
jgi:hypothetical protein